MKCLPTTAAYILGGNNLESELYFNCPYCAQNISMLFEANYGAQKYIEDCEVCCNPIEVTYTVEAGQATLLDVKKTGC